MKRSWLGAALLLLLLGASLLSSWAMVRTQAPISRDLDQAAAWTLEEDWIQAVDQAREARSQWDRWLWLYSCFADHAPLEAVEAGFSQLEVFAAAGEKTAFAALCAQLARQVEAVGQAHALTWRNLV